MGSVLELGDPHCFVEVAEPADFPCSVEAVGLVGSQRFVEVVGLAGLAVGVEHWHLELVRQCWFHQPLQKMSEDILD
jgi:hypothetical protein